MASTDWNPRSSYEHIAILKQAKKLGHQSAKEGFICMYCRWCDSKSKEISFSLRNLFWRHGEGDFEIWL